MLRPFTQEFEHRQIKALLPQRLDRERENQLFVYFSQLIVYLTNKQTNSYERIITSPLLCQVWLEWLFANVSVLEWTTYRDKLSAIFQGIDLYVVAKGHNSCRHLIIQAYCAEIKAWFYAGSTWKKSVINALPLYPKYSLYFWSCIQYFSCWQWQRKR